MQQDTTGRSTLLARLTPLLPKSSGGSRSCPAATRLNLRLGHEYLSICPGVQSFIPTIFGGFEITRRHHTLPKQKDRPALRAALPALIVVRSGRGSARRSGYQA